MRRGVVPIAFRTSHPVTTDVASSYAPPVDQLLSLGEETARQRPWPDYLALGLAREHVPELVRMLGDPALQEWDDTPRGFWPVVHAWRALGQLRAEAAVQPLARRLAEADPDDDWTMIDIPVVLGMIGPASLPAARSLAAREDVDPFVHHAALEILGSVARGWPEARDRAVEVLMAFLRRWPEQDPAFNAFAVSALADAGATEAVDLMAEAFAAGAVDFEMAGDWEDVQIEMGLLAERTTPRPEFAPFVFRRYLRADPGSAPRSGSRGNARAKAKHRRKDARAARKRNRRR